jgi:TonB family protein
MLSKFSNPLFFLCFGGCLLLFAFNEGFGQKTKTPRRSKPIVISCGVCNQKAIFLPKPEYPQAALKVGASGSIGVQILIDEEGDVIEAETVTGHPLLRASSVKAALQAKFEPYLLSGNPVRVRGIIVYKYSLDSTVQTNQDEFTIYATNLPKPPFPSACNARFARNEAVVVEAEIDGKGNVTSATALSGHPCLKAAAVQAARFSKFEEPKVSNLPVKAKAQIVYIFIAEEKIESSILVNWVKPVEK